MKKKTIYIIGISTLIFIGAIVGICFFALNFTTTLKNIDLGNEKIPTFYAVVGKKQIMGFESNYQNGNITTRINYSPKKVSLEEIKKYFLMLEKNDFILKDEIDNAAWLYQKKSEDGSSILEVEIYFKPGEKFIIIYERYS